MEILRRFVSKQLSKAMLNKRAKQKDICEELGIDQPSVSRWLTGKTLPTDENFEKTAKYLGMTPEEILFPDTDGRVLDLLVRGLQILPTLKEHQLRTVVDLMEGFINPTLKEHQLRTVVDLMEGFINGAQSSQPSDQLTNKNKRPG